MKNVPSLKSNKNDSPKTPGGISKSLLTPCRRVGLSRNWKKQGPSPFRSPLAGNEVAGPNEEEKETRKRKERVIEEVSVPSVSLTNEGDKTPSRDFDVPRKKKSKTLISVINKSQEELDLDSNDYESIDCVKTETGTLETKNLVNVNTNQVSTPVRNKSKKISLVKSNSKNSNNSINPISNEIQLKENVFESTPTIIIEEKTQPKVPNDLAKECIVVIQKKIFKKDLILQENSKENVTTTNMKEEKPKSQVLFDSDSDNEPLIKKGKKPTTDDEDFIQTSKVKQSISKTRKLKTQKPTTTKVDVAKTVKADKLDQKPSSQSSFDGDDDDFEFKEKRTILIRNTYDKVKKPAKAKSTGSITQKDIDELKARIEAKKKILLTKAMSEDTKELRDLVKKWQKGCQDALMQLMDLMSTKLTDNKNMNYSEMLDMLKIPASIVGYDEENDCFKTPDDTNIILSNI